MKLEVGMFVRTNKGIGKIKSMLAEPNRYIIYTDIDSVFEYYFSNEGEWICDYAKDFSFYLISLIEVGDIIDYEFPTALGMERYEKVKVTEHLLNVLQNGENNHEYHILSVLTKEQFEALAYKVGE